MNEHPFMRHEEILKKVRLTTIIFAAVYIALAVCLITFPEEMQTIMGFVIGLALLALGGYRLYVYFRRQREVSILATDLFIGIVSILMGLICVIKRGSVVEFITIVYGVLLIAGCIIKLQNAIDLRHMGYYRWWIVLLLAVISGVFATLLILRPQFIDTAFIIIAGLFLLYDGLSAVVAVVLFEMNFRKIKKGLPIGRPEAPPPAPGQNAGPNPGAPHPAPEQNYNQQAYFTQEPAGSDPFNPNMAHETPAQDVFRGNSTAESGAATDSGAETLRFDPDTGEPVKSEE